jgi:hypothetical protein
MAVKRSSMLKKRAVRKKTAKKVMNVGTVKHARKHARANLRKKKLPKTPKVF